MSTHSPSPRPSSTEPSSRHASTPVEKQRSQLERLLKDPSKPAYIPAPPKEKTIRPAREMMKNVQGSSAGAGSGEFHVYKAGRRREYERLKAMEDQARKACYWSASPVAIPFNTIYLCTFRNKRNQGLRRENASEKKRQTPKPRRIGQNDKRRRSGRKGRVQRKTEQRTLEVAL